MCSWSWKDKWTHIPSLSYNISLNYNQINFLHGSLCRSKLLMPNSRCGQHKTSSNTFGGSFSHNVEWCLFSWSSFFYSFKPYRLFSYISCYSVLYFMSPLQMQTCVSVYICDLWFFSLLFLYLICPSQVW